MSKWKKCWDEYGAVIVLLIGFAALLALAFYLTEYNRDHRTPTGWENLPPLPRSYGEKVEYINGHEYVVKGSLVTPQYIHSPECLKCSARR